MKEQYAILTIVVALIAGGIGGCAASSLFWKRTVEELVVVTSIQDVHASYLPLKFLSHGDTNKAIVILKSNLRGAISSAELNAKHLSRPDVLTDKIVKEAIDSSEQHLGQVSSETAPNASPDEPSR